MKPLSLPRAQGLLPLVALTSLWLLAAACSSGGDSTGQPAVTQTPELPPPAMALENSLEAMALAPQFRFELTHPSGHTSLPGGLDLSRAEGAVVAPGRLSVTAEAELGRVFVKVDAVVIEGQTWMTSPLTGNWARIAPQDSPFSFLDPVNLVINVLAQTTEPTYPPADAIRNGQIFLDGQVPSEALRPLVGTVLPGQLLDITLSLQQNTFLLNSARLSGRLQPEDEDGFVRLITFSGFDAAITIEPPL